MDTQDDASIIIHKINPKEARVEVVTQLDPEGAAHAPVPLHAGRGEEEGGAGDEHACRGEEEGEGEPRHVGPVLAPHAAHEVRLGRRADATQQAAKKVEDVPEIEINLSFSSND